MYTFSINFYATVILLGHIFVTDYRMWRGFPRVPITPLVKYLLRVVTVNINVSNQRAASEKKRVLIQAVESKNICMSQFLPINEYGGIILWWNGISSNSYPTYDEDSLVSLR